jgi:hypothetical protein
LFQGRHTVLPLTANQIRVNEGIDVKDESLP